MRISLSGGQFKEEMIDPTTKSLMLDFDSDPRVLWHEIEAERRRCRAEEAPEYDHPGIHLYPNHNDDLVFSGDVDFDVHFDTDPDYEPKTNERSPFDVPMLQCRNKKPESTGPILARNGQRYFKYTIVSPGEDPKKEPTPGNPAHLDPHILDHEPPDME